ncbi:MAG: Fic family protein [Peptococcaceae bacterium]|nr:Fic family protein [Peptococcaceae bacterium]
MGITIETKLAALLRKRDYYLAHKDKIDSAVLKNYNTTFDIVFAHNSTAIEGNTLSLMETKLLLEDKLSVGNKDLREIYEVVNHNKAFSYIRSCVSARKPLDEKTVKDIHAILMENIITGGIYRDVGVRIAGAQHSPPSPHEAFQQIKYFFMDLPEKTRLLNPIDLAAWTHAEFVRIHPFVDGNGRTSRLIMNYQLLSLGFLPISIAKEDRFSYFEALEAYAVDRNLTPFAHMVLSLAEEQLDQYIAGIPQSGLCPQPKLGERDC